MYSLDQFLEFAFGADSELLDDPFDTAEEYLSNPAWARPADEWFASLKADVEFVFRTYTEPETRLKLWRTGEFLTPDEFDAFLLAVLGRAERALAGIHHIPISRPDGMPNPPRPDPWD